MKPVRKPIDLIVANFMHQAVTKENLVRSIATAIGEKDHRQTFGEAALSALLIDIACNASTADIIKALTAVGAPASVDSIYDGLQAVKDRQTA